MVEYKTLCDAGKLASFKKIHESPPWWMCLMWALSLAFMIGTVTMSLRTIWFHAGAAQRSGFTRGLHISLGLRADLIVSILALPMSYAVTAAIQTCFPDTNDVMSFIRTLHFSTSIHKCVGIFHVLAGGHDHLKEALPTYPVKAFNAPPLCCIFCWPCCKRPLSLPRDIQILIIALRQFAVTAPVITLVDILVSGRAAASGSSNTLDTVVFVLVTICSMTATWAFNALSGLLAPIVQRLNREYPAVGMGKFVGIHMLAGKIIDLIVVLVMRNTDIGCRVEDPHLFGTMFSGFIVGVVVFALAAVGPRLFPWSQAMYPPRDEAGFPPDTIALLQLNGVRTDEWPARRPCFPSVVGQLSDRWCWRRRALRSVSFIDLDLALGPWQELKGGLMAAGVGLWDLWSRRLVV